MLNELLSKNECSKCKVCCLFDSYDLWETPVISDELADKILQEISPEQKFMKKDSHLLFKMEREPDEDLYYCPMLDKGKGCKLGDAKPFDCRIWPLRVMSFNDARVITISPICPVIFKKPLADILRIAKKLAPIIFSEADRSPAIIKPFIQGYPILVVESKNVNL